MLSFAYLLYIDLDENNNRYYRMKQIDNSTFVIEMGRVGAKPVAMKQSMRLWDRIYNKKISEGYVDRSEYCEVKKKNTSKYKPIPDESIKRLMKDLASYANKVLKENYTISWQEVNRKMISDAQDVIFSMSEETDIEVFNQKLASLFAILPRPMSMLPEMKAKTKEDIPEILIREQDLLDVMAAKIRQEEKADEADDRMTILEALGLTARCCTKKEEEQIKRFLSAESAPFFKQAFRISNKKTDERFYKYLKDNHMSEKDIHYFYHGSKNANYFGIMSEGLLLNPKAPITGKMFGYGLYFASRAKKSINYTDLSGSYWAHGDSEKAYLMVYKVAYKNQKDIYAWSSEMSSYRKNNIAPYDAVFAHAGQSLINDEIIVYDEAQCTLQYMIELGAK